MGERADIFRGKFWGDLSGWDLDISREVGRSGFRIFKENVEYVEIDVVGWWVNGGKLRKFFFVCVYFFFIK